MAGGVRSFRRLLAKEENAGIMIKPETVNALTIYFAYEQNNLAFIKNIGFSEIKKLFN